MYSILIRQTHSDSFSYNLSKLIVGTRLCAVNYIATDFGKTYQEVERAYNILMDEIDGLNFHYLTHINLETDFVASFIDGGFELSDDKYPISLVDMVNFANSQIFKLAQGMCNNNRDEVYSAYCELSNNDNFILNNYEHAESIIQENNPFKCCNNETKQTSYVDNKQKVDL